MKEIVLQESASGVFKPMPTRAEKRAAKRAAEKRREFWDTIGLIAFSIAVLALLAGLEIMSHWLQR